MANTSLAGFNAHPDAEEGSTIDSPHAFIADQGYAPAGTVIRQPVVAR